MAREVVRMYGVFQPTRTVVSPVLANLFMYYAFDELMRRTYPYCSFERYADDTVINFRTEA